MKDQQAYKIQPCEQIRKQHHELETQLKEQEEHQRNLLAFDSLFLQHQQSEDSQSLYAILEQSCALEKELEAEKERQRKPQEEIFDMTMKHSRQSSAEVSINHKSATQPQKTQKATRTLEHKLERASTQFCKELTNNNHLRQDIQALHGERVHFLQLHNRLQKDLQGVRKKIGELNIQSTAACDARVAAQSKMTVLREEAAKGLAQGDDEVKKLERVLAQKRHLNKFMTTKHSERSNQDEGQEMGHRRSSELREQRRTDIGQGSLDTLEGNVPAVTGDNLDVQSSKTVQVEDRNSTLVSFVVEQIKECKAVEDDISQTQCEIDQLQMEDLQKEQDPRWLLEDSEEKEKIQSQDEQNEKEANSISNVLEQIKTGVNRILSKMDCDCTKIESKLDSITGINDNNIVSYLGLMEEKANELHISLAVQASKDEENYYNPDNLANLLLGQNPDMLKKDVTQSAINAVAYDAEWSPVAASEERPYSTSELREKIMKHLMHTTTGSSKISLEDNIM
ncbi:coiled-coil domain-containing protein 114 [Genypterus blacodes]|uniref:coiled-coil domain-containing protein 114 n=1 Tax=Genypterus blacodes TaxID=154954 RepID=UPI003F76E4D3